MTSLPPMGGALFLQCFVLIMAIVAGLLWRGPK